MGAYNPHVNLYNPTVGPDTKGISEGIASAGQSIGNALTTYAGWKQQSNRDERNFEQQGIRDERMFQQQMERDDKNWGQQMQYADKQKTAKEQEEMDAADGLVAATVAAYPGSYTPDTLAALQKMKPKEKLSFASAMAAHNASQFRTTQQLQMEQQRRQQDYDFQKQNPPQPWSVQAGDATIYGVGNSPMGSTKPQRPDSLQPNQGPNGETIWTYGDKVIDPSNIMIQKPGPYGKGEGLVPLQPKQPAPVRGVPVKQPDGSVIFMDPTTGRPLAGQGGPSAAPSKTLADFYN